MTRYIGNLNVKSKTTFFKENLGSYHYDLELGKNFKIKHKNHNSHMKNLIHLTTLKYKMPVLQEIP